MKLPDLKKMLACAWTSASIGAVLTMIVGVVSLLLGVVREPLANLSYDLLFALRPNLITHDVAMVYMDEFSEKNLQQSPGAAWDRKLHAQLLERLTADHARAVVFDIVFGGASQPANDARLVRAMKIHGRVVLAAEAYHADNDSGITLAGLDLPYEPFRQAAAGWGIVNVVKGSDRGIREAFPELDDFAGQKRVPTLAWKVAEIIGANTIKEAATRDAERSLNYYGPPGWLPSVSYYRALQSDGPPPGFFSNRVVFVGAQFSADFSGKGKDEFATAFTRFSGHFAPGVEIQATNFLNLLHRNWWTHLHPALEFLIILIIGLVAGSGLVKVQPVFATALAIGGLLLLFAAVLLLAWWGRIWFDWFVAVPEVGVALLWAILCSSLKLYVDRQVLAESLAYNLSPACVKEILKRPDLLCPGATKQEVSVLFSDIASFSKITGRMDPDDLFKLLNQYYEAALTGIHQTDGTVLQLIGDAIFAIWNAPLPQEDHHVRACRAALTLRDQLLQFDVRQQSLPLRTRVGLHAGTASVGNLGSAKRFEYSAIGDNTNLASRLEGLNKQLGTEILASRDIQKHIEKLLLCRLVGHFKFKGVDRLLEVHELLGPLELAESTKSWREAFAHALFHFQRRQFDAAEAQFKLASQLRHESAVTPTTASCVATDDGPSLFYLARIETLRKHPLAPEWNGEIELTEK